MSFPTVPLQELDRRHPTQRPRRNAGWLLEWAVMGGHTAQPPRRGRAHACARTRRRPARDGGPLRARNRPPHISLANRKWPLSPRMMSAAFCWALSAAADAAASCAASAMGFKTAAHVVAPQRARQASAGTIYMTVDVRAEKIRAERMPGSCVCACAETFRTPVRRKNRVLWVSWLAAAAAGGGRGAAVDRALRKKCSAAADLRPATHVFILTACPLLTLRSRSPLWPAALRRQRSSVQAV